MTYNDTVPRLSCINVGMAHQIADLKLIRLTKTLYVNPAQISHLLQDEQGRLQIHVIGISGIAATIPREAAGKFLDRLGGYASPADDL